MTPAEFKLLLADTTDARLLEPCLRSSITPFVFATDVAKWEAFRADISTQLEVNPTDLAVVGSARFGFSLKPDNNLRAFRDNSDVDVVVVSEDLFDRLWIDLLSAVYPRPPILNMLGGWIRDRQNELYTGWLSPLAVRLDRRIRGPRVQPVLEFNLRWFTTFKHASRHIPRRHEDVKARLYRTWRHAELYHLHSLAELRRHLMNRR